MIIVSRSIKKRTKRGNTNNYLTWPFGNICRNLYFSNAKVRVSRVSAGPPSISSISQYWILSNAIVMPESRWFVIALFPRVMDASTLLHNRPFISVLWAVTSMMMLNTPLTFRQQNNWQFVAAIFIFAAVLQWIISGNFHPSVPVCRVLEQPPSLPGPSLIRCWVWHQAWAGSTVAAGRHAHSAQLPCEPQLWNRRRGGNMCQEWYR